MIEVFLILLAGPPAYLISIKQLTLISPTCTLLAFGPSEENMFHMVDCNNFHYEIEVAKKNVSEVLSQIQTWPFFQY